MPPGWEVLTPAAGGLEVPGGLESIDARGSSVVVGTSDGQLLLCSTEPSFALKARRSLGCGRKPVEVVTVADAAAEGARSVQRGSRGGPAHSAHPTRAGGVLALCDATVLVCQISDGLQISGALAASKGCISMCMDTADAHGHIGGAEVSGGGHRRRGAPRVCVGLRRRLQLYLWSEREGSYVQYQSLELPHTPVSLAWHAEAVIVGFKKASGYAIVRVPPRDDDDGATAAPEPRPRADTDRRAYHRSHP